MSGTPDSSSANAFRVGITRDFLNEKAQPRFEDMGLQPLEDDARVVLEYFPTFERVATPEQIRDYDAALVLASHFTRESFAGVERLAVIARFGVGYDRIDVQACTDADVILFIAPNGVRYPMAESVVTWMLMLSKHAPIKDRLTREGRWFDRTDYMGQCLAGRTLGLAGLGNIGREVVRLIAPFGMKLCTSDPFLDAGEARALGVEPVELETLLRRADYVTIHCPLNDHTRGLIGEREIALLKPSAYLINTARGPIVDQAALVRALRERRIAGAALDVFETEPIDPADPLLALDNVILAPHAIGWTVEMMRGSGADDARGIQKVMRGEVPDNVVNPEVLERPGLQRKLANLRERFGG